MTIYKINCIIYSEHSKRIVDPPKVDGEKWEENKLEQKDTKIFALTDSFVESVGNFGASMGISKVVAQLYALLYISPEPLSLDDMADLLKISKGSVCMNIRYLEQWEAVKKIWVKGSRKDYYEANSDIPKIVAKRLKEGLNRRLGGFMKQLETLDAELKKTDGVSYENYKKKFEKIKELNNMVNKALSLAETFIK